MDPDDIIAEEVTFYDLTPEERGRVENHLLWRPLFAYLWGEEESAVQSFLVGDH